MKRSYSIALSLGLSLASAFFVPAIGQSQQQAQALLDGEQPQKAQQLLSQLIAQEPQKAAGYFYKGMAYLQEEQLDSAGIWVQKAAATEAKSALAQLGLAYWYQQSGKTAEAEAAFAKALEMSKSKDPEVLRWLVKARLAQEKPNADELLALLEKALKQAPQNPELYILKGDVLLLKGEGGPAVSSYEKAASLNTKAAKAQLKIGKLFVRTKNYGVAQQHLEQALAADPAYAPAYKELGELHFLNKKPAEASAQYLKYIGLTEKKHQARMRGGYFSYLAKDWQNAILLFEQVLAKEPGAVLIQKYHAYSLLEAGNIAGAEAAFNRYFSTAGAEQLDAQDHEKWAQLLLKQQKDSLAMEQYKLVLQKQPEDQDALLALGDLHFKHKQYGFSADAYSQLVKLRKQPKAQEYFALGRAFYYASRYPEADTAFSVLLQLQPELLAASLWKARTLSNLDPDSEQGLAKPYYEKVVEKGAAEVAKYKNELKEAYSYLGYYYYVKEDKANAVQNWAKVKDIDPQDAKAINALKALNP